MRTNSIFSGVFQQLFLLLLFSMHTFAEEKMQIQESIVKQETQKSEKDLPQFLFFKKITKQQYDKGMQLMDKLNTLVKADEFLKKKNYDEEINFVKNEFIPFIRTLKTIDEKETKIKIRTLHMLRHIVFRLDPSQERSKDMIEVRDWIKKQGLERLAVISFKNITKKQYDRGVELSIRYYNIVNSLKELAKQKKQLTEEINFVKNECIPFVRSLKPADETEKKIQMDTLETFDTDIFIFEVFEKDTNDKNKKK